MRRNKLIVLAGPTAVGKTDLSLQIAKQFETEILSADSRQCYVEMNIGTAKPSPEELAAVKHHFINSHTINNQISAGQYESYALEVLEQVFTKKQVAIMTGGSGLFLDAVMKGFDQIPEIEPEIRKKLNERLATEGLTSLVDELSGVDPEYYKSADIQNPQRVIRALEVFYSCGERFSSFHSKTESNRPFDILRICLERDRQELYDRINTRVDQMIESGLVEEVKSLSKYRELPTLRTVGYQEVFPFLAGEYDLDRCIELIKQNSRRYAKRQLTWFRRDPEYNWYHPDNSSEILKEIKTFVKGQV